MKEYLLFDADGTLYDFGKTEKIALSALFNELGIPENLLPVYHEGNRKCWDMYEKGEITLEELEPLRFQLFFDRIGNNAEMESPVFRKQDSKALIRFITSRTSS